MAASSSVWEEAMAFSGVSQVSRTPPTREAEERAAEEAGQEEWPQRMMCLTLRWATANSREAEVLMSVGEMMLAKLRWTKTSPGCRPRMVVSGMRESEQPIQTVGEGCLC